MAEIIAAQEEQTSSRCASGPSPLEPRPRSSGDFLLRSTTPSEIFTPEDLTAEQRMFAKTARDFVEREVVPLSAQIEAKDLQLLRKLIEKAGQLGLTAADIPEEFGGLGLGIATATLIYDQFSEQASFMNAYGCQVGIGCLPIIYFGSRELKERYLPEMAEGTTVGCFCLTEPAAGSDAMACRTRATLSEGGTHYVLEGTKQFITNAGIADVFIVFAKVDGKHLTAFVVDRDTPGLTVGPEEHKMGLRGASTANVTLQGARVPVENRLGEIGKGHKIAFNILNAGRLKQGTMGSGAGRLALGHALAYGLERKQFGKRLVDFGAIREKLAEMFARIYALEAAAYRTLGLVDGSWLSSGREPAYDVPSRLEEYCVECSIVKVVGAEVLDYVVDEALQCYGGYGYCSDYPVERFYRDSRINRIFEGTNEINRLFIPMTVMRRAPAGETRLANAMERLRNGAESGGAEEVAIPGLEAEEGVVRRLKDICLFSLGSSVHAYGNGLGAKQAVLSRLADLMIQAYVAESALLRAGKAAGHRGADKAALELSVARLAVEQAMAGAERTASEVLTALGQGQEREDALKRLEELSARSPVDTLALRDAIASRIVAMERLPGNG